MNKTEVIEIVVRVRITYDKELGSTRKQVIREACKEVKQCSFGSTDGSSAEPLTSRYMPKYHRSMFHRSLMR